MQRKQWFASGIIFLIAVFWFSTSIIGQSSPDENNLKFSDAQLGDMYPVMVPLMSMGFSALSLVLAVVCFVNGLLEKKEEKK